jgi:DNA-binding transcriptional ArsR family regulator
MVATQPGQRPIAETAEARIAKALAHPLRARILQRLGERVASPNDLALELRAPLGV